MSWGKVDDKLWGSPKWLGTPARARGLWVTALSYSMDQLTDGFIPVHVLAALGGSAKDATALVAAGLWEQTDGGWRFHDWHDYQPSRAAIETKRSEEASRKAEWRAKRAASKANSSHSHPKVESNFSQSPAKQPHNEAVTTPVVEGPAVGYQSRSSAFVPALSQWDTNGTSASVPGLSQECPVLPVPDPTRPVLPTEVRRSKTPSSADADGAFDAFWSQYPRKVSKPQAVKAWKAATKKATPDVVMAGLAKHLPLWAGAEAKFIPHASTWLNGERWSDEVATPESKPDPWIHPEGWGPPPKTNGHRTVEDW